MDKINNKLFERYNELSDNIDCTKQNIANFEGEIAEIQKRIDCEKERLIVNEYVLKEVESILTLINE